MEIKHFDIQRRVVAHKTVESWDTIPHAGMVFELDVTEIVAFTEDLRKRSEFDGVRATLNSVMLKAIAESIKASPDINSQLHYNKRLNSGALWYLTSIDIAVPLLASCNRMITPVLRNVGGLDLRGVCMAMETLKNRARNTNIELLLLEAGLRDTWERLAKGQILTVLGRVYANFFGPQKLQLPTREERRRYEAIPMSERLTADDLHGASTLVSNIGSVMPGLACHGALLEIIVPQLTAMVLAGVQKRPVVVEDEMGNDNVVIRKIMPVTFYLDHRALDFEHVTEFLRRLVHLCANPEELLDA